MNKTERQARRGTLRVISGVSTRKVAQKFFGGQTNTDRSDKLLTSEALIRLYNRKPQGNDEQNLLIILVAQKTGDLKKAYGGWSFRGLEFFTLRADVPCGIFRRLTPSEIVRNRIPKPD